MRYLPYAAAPIIGLLAISSKGEEEEELIPVVPQQVASFDRYEQKNPRNIVVVPVESARLAEAITRVPTTAGTPRLPARTTRLIGSEGTLAVPAGAPKNKVYEGGDIVIKDECATVVACLVTWKSAEASGGGTTGDGAYFVEGVPGKYRYRIPAKAVQQLVPPEATQFTVEFRLECAQRTKSATEIFENKSPGRPRDDRPSVAGKSLTGGGYSTDKEEKKETGEVVVAGKIEGDIKSGDVTSTGKTTGAGGAGKAEGVAKGGKGGKSEGGGGGNSESGKSEGSGGTQVQTDTEVNTAGLDAGSSGKGDSKPSGGTGKSSTGKSEGGKGGDSSGANGGSGASGTTGTGGAPEVTGAGSGSKSGDVKIENKTTVIKDKTAGQTAVELAKTEVAKAKEEARKAEADKEAEKEKTSQMQEKTRQMEIELELKKTELELKKREGK